MELDFIQWTFISILLILPLLYELNGTFKYYAKIFLYYLCVNIAAVLVSLLSLWRPGDVENYGHVVWIIRGLRRLFGIDCEVRGQENLKDVGPCVVVANHQTSLDFFGQCFPSMQKVIGLMLAVATMASVGLRIFFSLGLALYKRN